MDSSKSRVNDLSRRFKRFRWLIFPAITLLFALLIAWPKVRSLKFIYAVEQASLSLRFQLRGFEDPGKDKAKIVLVKVDDLSLFPSLSESDIAKNPQAALLAEPWPWNRKLHGVLAQRLIDAGASVVAFDFVFPGPNSGDLDFLDVIEANEGRIVLGYDYTFSTNEHGEKQVEERLPYDDLLPLDESEMIGFVNINRDPDGVLRRAKLKTNVFEETAAFVFEEDRRQRIEKRASAAADRYSFAVQTVLLHAPELLDEVERFEDLPIINFGGYTLDGIDYFPGVSYVDVILDNYTRHGDIFKDAIVFVGPFSDFFKDVQQTPYVEMFGVETHGHVARSLLNGSFYKEVSTTWLLAIIAILSVLICSGFLLLRSAAAKGVFLILLLVGNLILSHILFIWFSIITPITPVVWLVGVGGSFLLLLDYIIEQYERRRLKSYLDRYVSPEVAQLIVQDTEHLAQTLRGAKRSIVTMFSDIRGFTAMSENTDPEKLVEQLNEYFEVMVGVILAHNGSLNKYIGDAILAVWGGIYSDGSATDCQKALDASLGMLEALDELNKDWTKKNLPTLDIGIGLNFGEGFVGNLGHSQRKEFAVMGDVVNLASRLEGLTKPYGSRILISEDMVHCLDESESLQEIDRVRVKGRSAPVRIYRPRALSDGDSEMQWSQALDCFRQGDFDAAAGLFAAFKAQSPEDAKLADLFISRCEQHAQQLPAGDWDGVTNLMEK